MRGYNRRETFLLWVIILPFFTIASNAMHVHRLPSRHRTKRFYVWHQSTILYAKKSGFDYFCQSERDPSQSGIESNKTGLNLNKKKTFKSLTKPLTNFFLGPNLAEPIKLDINPELKNMINSDNSTPVYQPSATKPVSAPVKTFEPSKEWGKAKKSLLFLRLILINDFDQFQSERRNYEKTLNWSGNTRTLNYHSCSLTHRSTP